MKAFLMYPDQDFDLQRKFLSHHQALIQDLELPTLFNAMARGDTFLFEVAKQSMLSSVADLDTISYRQQMLQDCLKNASIVKDLYTISVTAIEGEKKNYLGYLGKYPDMLLRRSMEVLQVFVELLKKLRRIADEHASTFESAGFIRFFTMLQQELNDDYFASIYQHFNDLKFHNGVLMSAELGQGNKVVNYTLRQSPDTKRRWIERIFADKPPAYSFTIDDRDETGTRALAELKDRGVNHAANALAQSVDHLLSFFTLLRTELAFYIGCLNVHEQLVQKGMPVTFPLPAASGERRHAFQGLYDLTLAFTTSQRVVSNTVNADERELVIITGANQGGKSTFLRSIGLAQLMMQCGMFVPAEAFQANVSTGLFTHYKRKEDATMKSGKLDEELKRMSALVDAITPDSLLLFNESFAATNEREGSEIARQIISALLEKRIKVFFVTHLYDFAHGFYEKGREHVLFLRAERQADGSRTFKMHEGEPLQTSFGEDVYRNVFGIDD